MNGKQAKLLLDNEALLDNSISLPYYSYITMPRENIILECTEAPKEGKPVSRYKGTKNKKLQQGRIELKKYNPSLKRRTLHREIK